MSFSFVAKMRLFVPFWTTENQKMDGCIGQVVKRILSMLTRKCQFPIINFKDCKTLKKRTSRCVFLVSSKLLSHKRELFSSRKGTKSCGWQRCSYCTTAINTQESSFHFEEPLKKLLTTSLKEIDHSGWKSQKSLIFKNYPFLLGQNRC